MQDSLKKTSGEIRALITLLGDDDDSIRRIARERLLEHGAEAEEFLREATVTDLEGKVRIEARHVLAKIRKDDLISSFYLTGLLEEEQVDLERTVFLLSRVGYPDLDVSRYQKELDGIAQRVRPLIHRLNPRRQGRAIVRAMNQILYDEEDFCGNVEEYYDPDNSYINRVLERRTGIPVSLTVVYLLIAQRLNVPIRGINMPVHFICQYHTPTESFLIDPFNKGRMITQAECMMMLNRSGNPFRQSFFDPVKAREIVARMIRNLFLIYNHRGEIEKASLLDRILKMLRTKE